MRCAHPTADHPFVVVIFFYSSYFMHVWPSRWAMTFFKRSPRRSGNTNRTMGQQSCADAVSIGSALSEKDQFDILVQKNGRRWFGGGVRDDDSTVSSITYFDHYENHIYQQQYAAMAENEGAQSWCCCSGMTEPTYESENALLVNKSRRPKLQETQSTSSTWCCTSQQESENAQCDSKIPGRRLSISNARSSNSLFDATLTEDYNGGKKRWRVVRWLSPRQKFNN